MYCYLKSNRIDKSLNTVTWHRITKLFETAIHQRLWRLIWSSTTQMNLSITPTGLPCAPGTWKHQDILHITCFLHWYTHCNTWCEICPCLASPGLFGNNEHRVSLRFHSAFNIFLSIFKIFASRETQNRIYNTTKINSCLHRNNLCWCHYVNFVVARSDVFIRSAAVDNATRLIITN